MGVKFKNNAFSTLDTAIAASDVGLTVAYGDAIGPEIKKATLVAF